MGAGAREHALVRSLLRDEAVTAVDCAPGNAGISQDVPVHAIVIDDPVAVTGLARELGVDLVVIGPEGPLVAGVADAVRAVGIACFGPDAAAARLEGSKAFAKSVMQEAGVATAQAVVCRDVDSVAVALDRFGAPYVVKDNGLAAGKGVVVTGRREVALAHAAACLARADTQVVVEDYLDGPEVSLFVITDGVVALPLLPAQDFKRALDGDLGPNTGGMGAYTPLEWLPAGFVDQVMAEVALPTINRMRERGTPFRGLLYIGLALTVTGPRVVEFNARFGDPETQSVLALLEDGLGGLLYAAATGTLADVGELSWTEGCAVTVVLAAEGYPDSPRVGDVITGIEAAIADPRVTVLHAGTRLDEEGRIVSGGGRVLSVVATGANLLHACDAAYGAIESIHLRGSHFRRDIASRAVMGEINITAEDR